MKRFFQSEAGAIVLWALASLVGAAILAPWLYQAGKMLAAHTLANDTAALMEWLGAACDRAKLGRYYSRAMLLSALCLLPLLIRRIRWISRSSGQTDKIIQLAKLPPGEKWQQLLVAFAIAGGILWATGMILVEVGAFAAETDPVKSSRILTKCALPAIGASLVEEWLFRGLLLGLWMRTAKPMAATIGSSLLFSFLHFLKPPGGVTDPTHPLAGFELLGGTMLHFTEPRFFFTDFATLTVIGLILCWTRLRTQSLWFPIGLHAGWVFAYAAFNLYYNSAEHMLHPWGVGDNLRSGLVPMVALAITALSCHAVLKNMQRRQSGAA